MVQELWDKPAFKKIGFNFSAKILSMLKRIGLGLHTENTVNLQIFLTYTRSSETRKNKKKVAYPRGER
jgi:hypothetical protein